MAVDKKRITFLLGEVEKALSILKEFQKEEKAKIIGDPKILGSVKYYFIVIMEGCIDVGNHILSREHWGVPESYADVFTALGQSGVIPDSLAQKLAPWLNSEICWSISITVSNSATPSSRC